MRLMLLLIAEHVLVALRVHEYEMADVHFADAGDFDGALRAVSSFTVKLSPTETLSISASCSEITAPLLTSICGWWCLRSRNVRYSVEVVCVVGGQQGDRLLIVLLPAVFDSSS